MNKKGNPNIGKIGKATQLKAGEQRTRDAADAGRAERKRRASIRANVRRLARFEPSEDDKGNPLVTVKALKQAFGADTKGKRLNMAEIWACIHAQQATQDFRAMRDLIENVDGKQVDTHLHKTTDSYADLVNMAAGNAPKEPDDEE